MRRKDREKDKHFALEVIRSCEYGTLATVNKDNSPYCISVSPVLMDDYIYFHCAKEGKKLDNIAANNAVCFSCATNTKVIPEKYTTLYESAVVFGKCFVVKNKEEKIRMLQVLSQKYTNNSPESLQQELDKYLDHTCVCKITIDEITGKAHL